MYLDVDGDGVYSQSDSHAIIGAGSGPMTVDVYLSTNSSYGGPEFSCSDSPEGGPGLNSYTVNLYSFDAPLLFENVQNEIPGWVETTPLTTYPYALTVGYSGFRTLPPGTYHLLRMTVTALPTTLSAGCPAIGIVPSSCYSPPGIVTSFGSDCPGVEGDGVLRYGEDWYGYSALTPCTDNTGRAPQIACPASVEGEEGKGISFSASVIDPDCDSHPMFAEGLPAGATLSNPGPFVMGQASQTLSWTPAPGQAGAYSIQFYVTDPDPFNFRDRLATCTTQVTVRPANSSPTARAGGPYSGVQGVGIWFNGSGSSDPDGDALTYVWSFGDGKTGVGAEVLHTYVSAASTPYVVALTVSDGSLADGDTTLANVRDTFPATVFYPRDLNYIFPQILPTWVWFESADATFMVRDAVLSSVSMGFNGATIRTNCKSGGGGDVNRNGTPDARACFARHDLRDLFAGLPNGKNDVTITLDGDLATGGAFHGSALVHVIKLGFLGAGALAAVSPNPLNPQAKLTFVTTQPGAALVQVFDINGRLVRTLMPEQSLAPGIHEILVDGRNEQGNRLASGIYYYRVRSNDGVTKGAFAVLK
jgi:hypothetical protein